MVATRRTAPTAADTEMPDPELALKKKPVRKTAAKATAAKTETKATTTKNTRRKKAAEPDTEAVEEAPKPKATRGRPKKTVEVAKEPEPQPEAEVEEPAKPAKATRATRAGSVRSKKTPVAVEEAPELPAPKEAKPARQTRAAATKAAPLSPKKITQVAKPATRNAKAADNKKPAAKGAAAKGSVRSRGTVRGRAVSDENADVPELAQPVEEDDSVIMVSSTPVKKKPVTRRQAAKKQELEESEITMSIRDTTPTASPARSHDEVESQADEPSADLSTPKKQDQTANNDDSDDELCGPKTPMRRGSPGAEARYQESAQRTIRRYNEEQRMQTPARRYAVLGSQHGTPQTQKPYCKPAAPSSEVRPMTVSRGANRAFVFKDLRDGAPELTRRQEQHRSEHESIAEEEDVSFIPDDNIIAIDEDDGAHMTTPSGPPPLQLASPPTSSTEVEDEDEATDLATEHIEIEDFGADASESADEDADITIVTEKHDDETEGDKLAQQNNIESFETEDTVIVNRPEQAEEGDVTMSAAEDSDEDSVIHHETAASQTPETMVWENVQPEQTIAVNFDEHLSESRSLPQPEPTEVLDIASRLDSHLEQERQAVAGAEEAADGEDFSAEEEHESPLQQETSIETPNVDLNDYFDMNALAEPTQVVDSAPQPDVDGEVEMADAPAAVEADVVSEDELEATVVHNELVAESSVEPAVEDEPQPAAEAHEVELIDPFSEHEDSALEEDDLDVAPEEDTEEHEVPHYARSTFASRRKSLPATSMSTPVRTSTRPNTSDGASIPRLANPFAHAWWARPEAASTQTTPHKSRSSMVHGAAAGSELNTPLKAATPAMGERYPIFTSRQNQVDHSQTAAPARFRDAVERASDRRQTFHRAISGKTREAPTPIKPSTPVKAATPVQKPRERYPLLGSQPNTVDHSQTVAQPKRFHNADSKPADRRKTFHKAVPGKMQQAPPAPSEPATPAAATTVVATPKERYPALGSRANYADHAKTAAPPARFQDPSAKPATRRQTFHRAMSGKAAEKEDEDVSTPVESPIVEEATTTPQPQQTPTERFPRLRPQSNYQDHAKTAAAPRFQTPDKKSPAKRPATTQKPSSMRKAALRNSASTPMKTPLKAPAMTPGQEPMTPHPAAPLCGVLALVEVYTLEGASASAPFTALLLRLGAKTTRSWNERVTHVIFKDGSPTTLQRVRLHNKDVAADATSKGNHVFCVNSRWVSDCDTSGAREDESDEAYAVDVEEVPRGGKRRRKSMEPSALMNLGGNIVRDRKSSLGRASQGRASGRISEASPAKKAKMAQEEEKEEQDVVAGAVVPTEEKENSTADEGEEDEEPATPAWIARPDELVQRTAPMKRVRKLELAGKQSRRLTLWDGGSA